ncbi:hypothetical protein Cgig2_015071 [Carnegiea gigantea]|uniref:Stalled ribosome sensor GCN1-like N-terminal domain-containing protein n=1 Tax=Carnegiea gigantea TaxID=171969 RepID=A0A9Q1GIK1_9CARY|nr:hypothetical protein Cgig2_015071 [Carnegiea gigantea]
MTGKDKDYCYMATSDLLNELSKEAFKPDSDLEIKLANTILQQLDDSAGDVSGLAVKWLAICCHVADTYNPTLVNESRVLEMMNKLCDKLLNVKEQHHDVASIALKMIVSEVSSLSAPQIVLDSLTPQLTKGITGTVSTNFNLLENEHYVYGNLSTAYHEELLAALLSQLNSNQATIRKKAVSCIASLASSLSDDLLTKVTVEVVDLLKRKGTKAQMTRTNIQMIGALSRAVGYCFGPYLGDTVPLLINYCKSASENDEELREYSLQALESFLLRCPRDIARYCDEILHLTLEFLSYDPNFNDMEEDTDGENPEEEEDDESANEYTNDEDASWKVRRAAAKCLAGLIVSQPEMLSNLYEEACPKLIDRFKEREENVKAQHGYYTLCYLFFLPTDALQMDVFNTFIELLRQTGNVTSGQMDTDEMSPRWLLKQEVPKIVKSINRQLREKSIKTKDNSSTSILKIEGLVFTRLVLASHAPSVFHPHIKAISGPVLSAVGERYYKVTAEALRVCGELVRVLRPSIEASGFDFKPYVHPIYNAIIMRLTNQDQDQVVKECAITCMGLVISTFGDNLTAELPTSLPVPLDRMGNEITRLTAVNVGLLYIL